MDAKLHKNQPEELLELYIESIGFEGVSVAKSEGCVYFVKGGVPGDKVIARVLKRHKTHTDAKLKEIISPSEHRRAPFCIYFGTCGGCSLQCVSYEQQLYWKKQNVIDAHKRIGKLGDVDIGIYHDVMPARHKLHYRNKMDFSFSSRRWFVLPGANRDDQFENANKDFALGLHTSGSFDKVLDITECKIQNPLWTAVMGRIREKAIEFGAKPYDFRRFSGFLKGLTLRHSAMTDETMCILTTNSYSSQSATSGDFENETKFMAWYRKELKSEFSAIVSVVHAINTTNGVNVGEIQFVEGKKFITEHTQAIEFRISPFSFFQTNSHQLHIFITLILAAADLQSHHIVWDLYCGTGSITLPASRLCSTAYGLEMNLEAIKDAKKNAEYNDITNAEFFGVDLHSKKLNLLEILPLPDVVIVDPPRSGLHPNIIKSIINVKPAKLVYVSCNPATQARDLSELKEYYNLLNVYPVDMFPHTYHIEVIVELELK